MLLLPPTSFPSNPSLPAAGEYLLVGALDSTLRLVGTEKGEVVRVFRGHTNKLYCSSSTFVTTLPKQAVASGSEDGSLFVWDINTAKVGTPWRGGHRGCGVLAGTSKAGCEATRSK